MAINSPLCSWIYKTCSFSILFWSENAIHCNNKCTELKERWRYYKRTSCWTLHSSLEPGFHILVRPLFCDCPGNTATMITAGFSRLKPRTVTRQEDKLGREPSPGKFTLTPLLLVPSPDMSPHMAGERALVSEDISVIFHIITSANLKMTEYISP